MDSAGEFADWLITHLINYNLIACLKSDRLDAETKRKVSNLSTIRKAAERSAVRAQFESIGFPHFLNTKKRRTF